ncbi:hypothetical protein [Rugamonas aquatica]|uniref:Uncharacterized protein n=1 Tax=Rugamonas aquatica TaxID=2743357 RepID=A0A6A7N7B9_9BURK|nr:hypothetical protein [Rugamonas aquatica]MQA40687.1 hypothetical protein [Rugamonas aquatica]
MHSSISTEARYTLGLVLCCADLDTTMQQIEGRNYLISRRGGVFHVTRVPAATLGARCRRAIGDFFARGWYAPTRARSYAQVLNHLAQPVGCGLGKLEYRKLMLLASGLKHDQDNEEIVKQIIDHLKISAGARGEGVMLLLSLPELMRHQGIKTYMDHCVDDWLKALNGPCLNNWMEAMKRPVAHVILNHILDRVKNTPGYAAEHSAVIILLTHHAQDSASPVGELGAALQLAYEAALPASLKNQRDQYAIQHKLQPGDLFILFGDQVFNGERPVALVARSYIDVNLREKGKDVIEPGHSLWPQVISQMNGQAQSRAFDAASPEFKLFPMLADAYAVHDSRAIINDLLGIVGISQDDACFSEIWKKMGLSDPNAMTRPKHFTGSCDELNVVKNWANGRAQMLQQIKMAFRKRVRQVHHHTAALGAFASLLLRLSCAMSTNGLPLRHLLLRGARLAQMLRNDEFGDTVGAPVVPGDFLNSWSECSIEAVTACADEIDTWLDRNVGRDRKLVNKMRPPHLYPAPGQAATS